MSNEEMLQKIKLAINLIANEKKNKNDDLLLVSKCNKYLNKGIKLNNVCDIHKIENNPKSTYSTDDVEDINTYLEMNYRKWLNISIIDYVNLAPIKKNLYREVVNEYVGRLNKINNDEDGGGDIHEDS